MNKKAIEEIHKNILIMLCMEKASRINIICHHYKGLKETNLRFDLTFKWDEEDNR